MKQINKIATAVLLGSLLVGDITTSLTPQTYAESNGYDCYDITVNTPTISDVCATIPNPTSPEACFVESTQATLPVYYHTKPNIDEGQNYPYPLRNLTTFNQNLGLLSTPITIFNLSNAFEHSPMPISTTVQSVGTAQSGTITYAGSERFEYTPNVGFTGEDKASYTTQDSNGATHAGKIYLKLEYTTNPINGEAKLIAKNILKDSPNTVIGTIAKANSNYSATITTAATHGTVTIDNSDPSHILFKYTPTAGYTGEDTFKYTLTNGVTTSSITSGVINIYDIMSQPIAPTIGVNFVLPLGSTPPYNIYADKSGALVYAGLFKNGPEKNIVSFNTPTLSSGYLDIPVTVSTTFQNTSNGSLVPYSRNSIIRVQHRDNTAPTINVFDASQPDATSLDIRVNAIDAQNNQGTVVAQISQDNFATFQSYPISEGLITGAHSKTITNLPSNTYSVRIVITETDAQDVCLDFGGTGVNPNKRVFSTAKSFDGTTPPVPVQKLIRTGG